MSIPFFIASKYIKSKKDSKFLSFFTVTSITGIALGVAAVNLALSILGGFENTIKEKTIEFNSHITITTYGNNNINNYTKILDKIKQTTGKDLSSISPFIEKDAIIKSKHLSEGVKLHGIQLNFENSRLRKNIISGKYSFNYNNSDKGVILGRKLADKLFVKTGDRITFFTLIDDKPPSPENPPAIEQFFVTGIFESGMAEYDDLNAYIDFKEAQKMLNIPDQCSGFNLRLKNIAKIDTVREILSGKLGYPFYVRDFYQINKPIFTWLELQKKPIPIILGLIILVAIFNIVGTLLIMVLEKTKDIGILKAIGATKRTIIKTFLFQGLYISIAGIILGNLFALIISWLQLTYRLISLPANIYFVSSVPILINFNYNLIISLIALILGILAALIPSYIASKIKPINAIRFE